MKRYSDLMRNGVLHCDITGCAYNHSGKCCLYASSNEDDRENIICQGKVRQAIEPLRVKMFRADFSDIDTERLKEYAEMFEKLSSCVDLDSPNLTDIWKVISCFKRNVSSELIERKSREHQKLKEREIKRKKGLPVATTKRNIVRPLKSKKLR